MAGNNHITLSSPRLRVILGDVDNPESWTAHDVQTIGRDTVAAETLFGVQKIGRPIDHPVRSLAAMAYFGLVRTGRYSGPFDAFETEYIEIAPIGADVAYPSEAVPAPA